jgi:hypothetical protein
MRIVTVAALFSLPIVAAATSPTLAASYGSYSNGGGSYGYNRGVATDYRLKHHAKSKRAKPLHMQAAPRTAPAAPAAGAGAAAPAAGAGATAPAAGAGAAKQPMGRP